MLHTSIPAVMSGFIAVNAHPAADSHAYGQNHIPTTPTTPRPDDSTSAVATTGDAGSRDPADESTPNTPTRDSFGGLSNQQPLPTPSLSSAYPHHNLNGKRASVDESVLGQQDSNRSSLLSPNSQDVDMDHADSEDDDDLSDDDSLSGEPGRPSKKKKGQRFFCTDFPPCTLSFTRSEHLARHIR